MATTSRAPAASLPMSVRPVGAQSTVDQVASEIRRAFLAGALAPGQAFSMAELSEQLAVSHIPVREALRRFEAQGLVTLRPSRSAVVAPIDADDVEDVYRLWILVCTDAAARACVHYRDGDFARIEATLDAFTALPQDSDEAFEGHHEFHLELLRPGLTDWDLRVLDMLWLVIERAVRLAFRAIVDLDGGEDPGRRAYAEHKPLLDAARGRDVARLQRELRHHHESHMTLVIAALPQALAGPVTTTQ